VKITAIVKELRQGKFIIVQDDKKRENEADLVMAAQFITPSKVTFILEHCSGIVCVPMSLEKIKKIGLPKIRTINANFKTTPYAVPVDYCRCHTGVSAYERYLTIKKLSADSASLKEFVVPGHVFPLFANKGGLQVRKGHTEAAVMLMKIAGLKEAAVICELMNTSANCKDKKKIGQMMKGAAVKEFAKKYKLKHLAIKDICEKN
jgi:3,4-dihydroxy 2-butanone 4-phosphate synthase/GTP cyclohydrolase II